MFNTDELKHILFFPLKDADARKKFLTLVSFSIAGFVIPVVPWLAMMGYAARIMRGIIEEDRPAEMPAWDDMGEMFVDGVRLVAFRLVATLPFLLLGLLFFILIAGPSAMMNLDPQNADTYGTIMGVSMMIIIPLFLIIFLLSLPLAVLLFAAEGHIVTNRSFKAGFRINEWWPIFRKNVAGFVLIYLVFLAVGFVISIPVAFAVMTIVLICLLPVFLVAITPYNTIVMYALVGHAYAQGCKAQQNEPIAPQ